MVPLYHPMPNGNKVHLIISFASNTAVQVLIVIAFMVTFRVDGHRVLQQQRTQHIPSVLHPQALHNC